MTQILLLVFVILLWSIVKPKREWFVVETRICTDDKLGIQVFCGNFCDKVATTNTMSKSSSATLFKKEFTYKGNGEFIHQNGHTVYVNEMAFRDSAAAILYFDRVKVNLPTFYASQKSYLWRIETRHKSFASVLLPLSPLYESVLLRMVLNVLTAPTLISEYPDKGWSRYFDEVEDVGQKRRKLP